MSATTKLTLQFDVEGSSVTIANVRSMGTAMSAAATELERSWGKASNAIEGVFSRMNSRVSAFSVAGGLMMRDGIYALSRALVGLGTSAMMVNQQFSEFEITLSSSLKSVESAKKITQEVAKITAYSPIPFKDIASTVTGLSVLPQLNARFVNQAQTNQLGDMNGLLRKSIRLVEMMTAFRPDKNPDEALFSIREAMGGEFRSLQRRFDVPLSILTNASGKSISQLKEKGPDAIFDAMFKAFDNIVSSSAISARARLPTVTLENLWEQLFQMPALEVGSKGLNRQLNDRLFEYLNKATYYFTQNPEVAGSGKFETSGLSKRISTAVTRMFNLATDKGEQLISKTFDVLGFEQGNGLLDRAGKGITAMFEYVSENAPKWMDYAKQFFAALFEAIKAVWGFLNPVLQFLGAHPKLAAAAAIAGPSNLINASLSLGTSALMGGTRMVAGGLLGGARSVGGALFGATSSDAAGSMMTPGVFQKAQAFDRYFGSTSNPDRVEILGPGARMLGNAGMTTGAGTAYKQGGFIPTSTALAAGMTAGGQATLTMAGIAGVATALASMALFGAAIAGLTVIVQQAAVTWMEVAKNRGIVGDANAQGSALRKGGLSSYLDSTVPGVSDFANKGLAHMSMTEDLLTKARNGGAPERYRLAEALGMNVTAQRGQGRDQSKINYYGSSLNVGGSSYGLSSDAAMEQLERASVNQPLAFMRAAAILNGQSATLSKANSTSNLSGALNESGKYTDIMSLLEQKGGMADFKARLSSTQQLSSTRLSTENLPFLEEFSKKVDPDVILRQNIKSFDKVYETVLDEMNKAQKSIDSFDATGLRSYVDGIVSKIETSKAALNKTDNDEIEVDGGRRVRIGDELKRLAAIRAQLLGTAIDPAIIDKLQADLDRSRAGAGLAYGSNQIAAFLRMSSTFAAKSKSESYGPAFDTSLQQFGVGIDGLFKMGRAPGVGGRMQDLKNSAQGMRIDTSEMSPYDKLLAEQSRAQNETNYYTTLKSVVQMQRDYTDQLIGSGKALEGGASNLSELDQSLESLTLTVKAGNDDVVKAGIALGKFYKSLGLDNANYAARSELSALMDSRSRGNRISTDSLRSASEKEAATGNYNSMDSFGKGWSSQFREGDDFMNMAREGVAAAQNMKAAFGDAFGNIITGTMGVTDAFRSMVVNIGNFIAKLFAQKAAEQLLGMVFSSGFGAMTSTASAGGAASGFAEGGYASGGYIGRGSGVRDDVPAMLMRGEYVLNSRAVSAIGRSNLERWNSGMVSHYARGGEVGMSMGSYTPSAHTPGNTIVFGDINYTSSGQSKESTLTERDMAAIKKEHEYMTIKLIEDYERRKRVQGR